MTDSEWNPLAVVAFVAAVEDERERNYGMYSDLHKDARGFRPRMSRDEFRSWTRERFDAEVEALAKELEAAQAAERRAEAVAIAKFDTTIAGVIAAGAGDRTTAVRWLAEADGAYGDLGYLEFLHGLPYGHLTRSV